MELMVMATNPGLDIFQHFRGEDTRNNFTSHLHEALRRLNIEIFHDTTLQRGLNIGPQLMAAINESKIFVVVFSTNYADSKWCLNELCEMMNLQKMNDQCVVLPVFLDIKKSDVGTQQGSYNKHLEILQNKFDQETVQKWREALQIAGQLPGLHLQDDANGDEKELLEQVVERIRKILHGQNLHLGVGIETRLKEVIAILNPAATDDVRVIAIYGPAGIGKTTIAKATYDQLAINFKIQHCCFLPNVKTIFIEWNGEVLLQKRFISHLIRKDESQIRIDSYHKGIERIERLVKDQKVLLVLDDVDNVEQLKVLGINRAIFGPGSRIIVITRDESVVHWVKLDATYEPRLLDDKESLEVFCSYAFSQNHPKEGYEEVSRETAHWGAGHPAVLKDAATQMICFDNVHHWKYTLKKLIHNSSR